MKRCVLSDRLVHQHLRELKEAAIMCSPGCDVQLEEGQGAVGEQHQPPTPALGSSAESGCYCWLGTGGDMTPPETPAVQS